MEEELVDGGTRRNRLKHGYNAGESDDPASDGDGESTGLTGLAASLRVLSESLLRAERAEAEAAKAREALRLRSENRRLESEAELTRLMLATELQIASLVSCRKRKRLGEDDAVTKTTQQVSQR